MGLADRVVAWLVFGDNPDKGAFAPVKRTKLTYKPYKSKVKKETK